MSVNSKSVRALLLGVLIIIVGGTLLWVSLVRMNTEHDTVTPEGISRILIQVKPGSGGLARREFTADGWVDGGHASGDPLRIYEEREQISEEEVEAIWAAASALGEELHAMDVAPQPDWKGHVELWVFFDDQRAMRLSWPFGEQHPDPRVQGLVEMLMEVDVGGW